MLNVRLAGDYQYGKLLFTWLSLVMSVCAVFSYEISLMRSGTEVSRFLRFFLPKLYLWLLCMGMAIILVMSP